ncbi:MAG: exodeoxyribonuclease VII small subunit [Candidatus Omnitrophota bacterium]
MAEPKFEEALKKLEAIVDELESGDVSLDGALKKHEDGVRLVKICEKKLEHARKKVELLSRSDDGSFELTPFGEDGAGEEPKRQGSSKKRKKI